MTKAKSKTAVASQKDLRQEITEDKIVKEDSEMAKENTLIAVLEDSDNIRELLTYTLQKQGYSAVGFSAPSQLYSYLSSNDSEAGVPDLFLLDIMLPEEDGIAVLKKLRNDSDYEHSGFIMLTAKDSEFDRSYGLDEGADDYVGKPFGITELLSRISSVLRRCKKAAPDPEDKPLVTGGLVLNEAAHIITLEDRELDLTLKEFQLLSYLMKNKEKVLTRNMIIDKIWGYDFDGETRTVDVHIGTLRQKLGPAAKMIKTVRGLGYKFSDK